MIGILKNNGMVALTGALGVACVSLAIAVVAADRSVERSQAATVFVAGLLILGGLVAMHRSVRGSRAAVALGTIVPGALLAWTIIAPITSLAILIWLVARRQPRRGLPEPAV